MDHRPQEPVFRLPEAQLSAAPDPRAAQGRPWLGVHFLCANIYTRVYRNCVGSAYVANCPRCGKSVRFRVGAGGTQSRFFEVSC
jgi:hypothetical protein